MSRRGLFAAIAASIGLSSAGSAAAIDWAFSGFATLGYARSNQSFAYQRYVDDQGTLKRDSVAGFQIDAKLGPEFAATLQTKLAAPTHRDDGVRASIAWGFLSWRPNNEWLLRAGKFRVPLYVHSETQDIGTTFDTATLPVEVYSQSPTNDFTGVSASRSWNTSNGEVVLDAYWGRARTSTRVFSRYDITEAFPDAFARPGYLSLLVNVSGLALAFRRNDDLYRAALVRAQLKSRSPLLFVDHYPFKEIPELPGVGYYDPEDIFFERAALKSRVRVPVVILGLDVGGPFGTRVAAEFGRRIVKETLGFDSKGAYVSVRRRWGAWTPYLTLATLRSTDGDRAEFAAVDNQRVPDFLPLAPLINLLQRASADSIVIYDQTSLALGTSYRLSPTSILKAEWQRVRVGQYSALIDPPLGVTIHHQRINLFSLSYSVVF